MHARAPAGSSGGIGGGGWRAGPSLSAVSGGHWVMASEQAPAGLGNGVGPQAASRLDPAVAAYLARFKGTSRTHTESDLRVFLGWCAQRRLDPVEAQRVH